MRQCRNGVVPTSGTAAGSCPRAELPLLQPSQGSGTSLPRSLELLYFYINQAHGQSHSALPRLREPRDPLVRRHSTRGRSLTLRSPGRGTGQHHVPPRRTKGCGPVPRRAGAGLYLRSGQRQHWRTAEVVSQRGATGTSPVPLAGPWQSQGEAGSEGAAALRAEPGSRRHCPGGASPHPPPCGVSAALGPCWGEPWSCASSTVPARGKALSVSVKALSVEAGWGDLSCRVPSPPASTRPRQRDALKLWDRHCEAGRGEWRGWRCPNPGTTGPDAAQAGYWAPRVPHHVLSKTKEVQD